MKFYTQECNKLVSSFADAEYWERAVSAISIGLDKEAVEKIEEIQKSLKNYPTASVLEINLKFLDANIVRQYYTYEICDDLKFDTSLLEANMKNKTPLLTGFCVHDEIPDFEGKIEDKNEVIDQELLYISSTGIELHITPAEEDMVTAFIVLDPIIDAVREELENITTMRLN